MDIDKSRNTALMEVGRITLSKKVNSGLRRLIIRSVDNVSKEICNLLLKAGADVNAKNDFGKTALEYAIYENNYEVCDVLIEAGADINDKVISEIIFINNVRICELLIRKLKLDSDPIFIKAACHGKKRVVVRFY